MMTKREIDEQLLHVLSNSETVLRNCRTILESGKPNKDYARGIVSSQIEQCMEWRGKLFGNLTTDPPTEAAQFISLLTNASAILRAVAGERDSSDSGPFPYYSVEDMHGTANLLDSAIRQLNPEALVTVEEAAFDLQLHPETILRRVRSGELPALRTSAGKGARIRIRRGDLVRIFGPGG